VQPTGDTPATVVVVCADGSEQLLERLDERPPDVGLIDRLLRLQLQAQRAGSHVEVRHAGAALIALAALLGVSDVLALEVGGQPELGEQLGVQEVVEARDPPV
jgi:hypothetical protein